MTRVTVQFAWRPAGVLGLRGGLPAFSPLPNDPGLSRLTFEWSDRPAGVYIGEAVELKRRGQHYRTPGKREKTSQRVNKELIAALSARVQVSIAVITKAELILDDASPVPLDLERKTSRLIVENAAMAAVIAARAADPSAPILLNRPGVGEAEWE